MYVMTARQTMFLLSKKQWHIQIWYKQGVNNDVRSSYHEGNAEEKMVAIFVSL